MIPFASQRGAGGDLAAHLQNEFDNEDMEVADLRGAIAQDLHGAFAEWELQAKTLTKCRNYLYSLSVNPDPGQGELTRAQYMDYIARVEQRLGLQDQPRAVVFHVKRGREHCHVVWSRIDAEQEKAVPLAFDHQALMMVTREFARDHGLQLPKGYGNEKRGEQLSLYEQVQQRRTGLTMEERKEQVTDAWRGSDSPQAFVQALAEKGYILATGNRPYVVVDLYGEMNALPKMIEGVRTKDVRAFLEKDYPPNSLPTVDEAKALAAQHRQALKDHAKSEQRADAIAHLKKAQAQRRQSIEKQQRSLEQRQHKERDQQAQTQRQTRDTQRKHYLQQVRAVRQQRSEHQPTGLAAVLGRVTGIDAIRNTFHHYQDRQRLRGHLKDRGQLRAQQAQDRQELDRRHKLQARELDRQLRTLSQIDRKELTSLEDALKAEQRTAARGGDNRMPAITLPDKLQRQPAARQEAARADLVRLALEFAKAQAAKEIALKDEFEKAAAQEEAKETDKGDEKAPAPKRRSRSNRRRTRKRDQGKDRGR